MGLVVLSRMSLGFAALGVVADDVDMVGGAVFGFVGCGVRGWLLG